MSIFMQLFQRQIGGPTYLSRRRAKRIFYSSKISQETFTLVLADIQFDVSLSSSHFFIHFFINVHLVETTKINN